jgi:hypothetical protein
MPHQRVAADGHVVGLSEIHQRVGRIEIVGRGASVNRPELHSVLRFELVELASESRAVLGLAEIGGRRGRADPDAALIGVCRSDCAEPTVTQSNRPYLFAITPEGEGSSRSGETPSCPLLTKSAGPSIAKRARLVPMFAG